MRMDSAPLRAAMARDWFGAGLGGRARWLTNFECRVSRCSILGAGRLRSWWSASRACQEKTPGKASSGRSSKTTFWSPRPSDEGFRLDMDALSRAVAEDRAAGFTPVAVAGNAGTVGTGAVDRLDAMAAFCAAEGLWLHVDAAYGGFAAVTERGRHLLRGIELADSIGLDAHKWFFQPYEAGCLLVKDENALRSAFAVRPDILQDTVWGANHPNFSDLGLQLSRSARALKVWMSVQTFGMARFRRAVEQGMDLAARAEARVRASPVLEAMNAAALGIVCFRVNPAGAGLDEAALDGVNRTVLARMFWDDPAFISSTMLHGTFALRMCIVNHTTTWDDVRETLEAVERFGNEALEKPDVQE